jgi:hypothetical protein
MQQLMAELRDPQTRTEVISLSRIAIESDRHIAQGELDLLRAFEKAWEVPSGSEMKVTYRRSAGSVVDNVR